MNEGNRNLEQVSSTHLLPTKFKLTMFSGFDRHTIVRKTMSWIAHATYGMCIRVFGAASAATPDEIRKSRPGVFEDIHYCRHSAGS